VNFMSHPYLSQFCFIVSLLISGISAVAAEQIYNFSNYRIVISPDTSGSLRPQSYQILVEHDDFLLTRLLAQSPGSLSKAYVTDLDSDGNFEIVVTFAQGEGDKAIVHFYDWLEGHLVGRKIPELSAEQSKGYKGNDEFASKGDKFFRIYQVYEKAESSWIPTNSKRHLMLSYNIWKWVDY
jgi:hypothetical protein